MGKSWIWIALLALAVPVVGQVVPGPGEWTEGALDTHAVTAQAKSSATLAAFIADDGADGDVDIYIGHTSNGFTKFSILNADDGCIGHGLDDNEWHIAYRDLATKGLYHRSTSNAGSAWSTPVQVAGTVDSSGYVCDVAVLPTGTILVVYETKSGDKIQSVRSQDGGATWDTPVLLGGNSDYETPVVSNDGTVMFWHDRPCCSGSDSILVRAPSNDGAGWSSKSSPVSLNGYGNTKHAPVALATLDSGRIVAVWDVPGFDKLESAYSDDGGSSWNGKQIVFDYSGAGSADVRRNSLAHNGENVWLSFTLSNPDQLVVAGSSNGAISWTHQAIDTTKDRSHAVASATDNLIQVVVRDLTLGGTDVWSAVQDGATPPSGGDGGEDPTGGGTRTAVFNKAPKVVRNATNLYGADVDETTGFTMITREGTGGGQETLRTWDAATLTQLGSTAVGACGFDGVSAGEKNVGYKDCTSSPVLQIRSRGLGTSQKPSGCNSDACPDTITDLDEAGALPDVHLLKDIRSFTVDYDGAKVETGSVTSIIGFAYSTFADASGGDVGVWGKFTHNNGDDEGEDHVLQADFTPGSTSADDLCSWRWFTANDVDPPRYVAAAQGDVGLRVWRVVFNDDRGAVIGAGVNDIDISSELVLSGSSSASGAHALACHGDTLYYGTGSKVAALNHQNGQTKWQKTDAVQQGAMDASGNGQTVAYANQTHVVVRDADDGALLGTGVLPSTDVHAVETDHKGGTVWVFTTDHIAVYDFEGSVCVLDCSFATASDTPGFFDVAGGTDTSDAVSRDIGGGVWGKLVERMGPTGAFVLGLVMIGAAAALAYKWAGPAPMLVGGAATLGMGAAVALVGFPIWIPITIAAGGIGTYAAVIAKRIGGARS